MRDQPPLDPPDPERGRPETGGHLRPTSPAVLTGWAVAGLVGGWLMHPLAERTGGTAPIVTWAQPLALLLVVAILGGTAWSTRRTVQARARLEPHQAVNRLVLSRACAYVGALVGGGYLGYALSWVGDSAELADERMWRSLLAAAAGAGICVTALLLERACRVRPDGDQR